MYRRLLVQQANTLTTRPQRCPKYLVALFDRTVTIRLMTISGFKSIQVKWLVIQAMVVALLDLSSNIQIPFVI